MTGEEIPRRMRRFYRNKPTEQEVRDKSSEIAINKVDSFRETHNRYPNREDLEDISKDVFEQLKRDLKREESELNDIYLGPEPKSGEGDEGKKSLLELRREKREQAGKVVAGQPEKKERAPGPNHSESRKQARKKGKEGAGATGGKTESRAWDEEESEIGASESGEEEGESIEELEERNRAGVKALAGIDELAQLESELSGEGESKEGDFDLVEKEVDTEMNSCPNCGSKASGIIYCPECGVAFCDHCAKKVEVLSDAVKYTCPRCGAEFKSRKPKG